MSMAIFNSYFVKLPEGTYIVRALLCGMMQDVDIFVNCGRTVMEVSQGKSSGAQCDDLRGCSEVGSYSWMVYFMENPEDNMDDLGVTSMDWKPPYCGWLRNPAPADRWFIPYCL